MFKVLASSWQWCYCFTGEGVWSSGRKAHRPGLTERCWTMLRDSLAYYEAGIQTLCEPQMCAFLKNVRIYLKLRLWARAMAQHLWNLIGWGLQPPELLSGCQGTHRIFPEVAGKASRWLEGPQMPVPGNARPYTLNCFFICFPSNYSWIMSPIKFIGHLLTW